MGLTSSELLEVMRRSDLRLDPTYVEETESEDEVRPAPRHSFSPHPGAVALCLCALCVCPCIDREHAPPAAGVRAGAGAGSARSWAGREPRVPEHGAGVCPWPGWRGCRAAILVPRTPSQLGRVCRSPSSPSFGGRSRHRWRTRRRRRRWGDTPTHLSALLLNCRPVSYVCAVRLRPGGTAFCCCSGYDPEPQELVGPFAGWWPESAGKGGDAAPAPAAANAAELAIGRAARLARRGDQPAARDARCRLVSLPGVPSACHLAALQH